MIWKCCVRNEFFRQNFEKWKISGASGSFSQSSSSSTTTTTAAAAASTEQAAQAAVQQQPQQAAPSAGLIEDIHQEFFVPLKNIGQVQKTALKEATAMAKMKDGHFEVSTHFPLTFIFVQEAMESFTSYDKINSIGGEIPQKWSKM